jgi:alpha-L-fucosidase
VQRREFVATGLAAMAAAGPARFRTGPARGAALPVPTPDQLAWADAELGMFFHFGINTFTDNEWGTGTEDPAAFDPTALDVAQWMRAAKAAGARYVVLTAKHHDGFCLWPSRTTRHSVKSSPWRSGAGDLVKEVTDAARASGLGVGLYLSPWDRNAPTFGTGAAYNDLYIAQLTELLTGYGPLVEVWLDGANGDSKIGKRQAYDWNRIHLTVRRLQPHALIFSDAGPDIRWVGNELGTAADVNWCTVDPSIVTEPGMDSPQVTDALQHGAPPPRGTVWRPAEADVSIRRRWFHHPAEEGTIKSASQLMDIWRNSVGRNANLLLNVPPSRTGLIGSTEMRELEAFGVAQRAVWASAVDATRSSATGRVITATLPRRMPVTGVVLEEDLREGQRVSGYRIEAAAGGGWVTLVQGGTVGNRRLDRCERAETHVLRITMETVADAPRIRRVRVLAG